MPTEETKKLVDDLDRLKERAEALRRNDDSRFEDAMKVLERRRFRSLGSRFEEHVWDLLSTLDGVIAAREPTSPNTSYRPDFLAQSDGKTFLIEAKSRDDALDDVLGNLRRSLDAFGADAALLVLPKVSESRRALPQQDGRISVIDITDLNTCLVASRKRQTS